jgi:NAD kinase
MYFAYTAISPSQLDSRPTTIRATHQILVKVDLQDRRHSVDNVDQFEIL